MELISIKSLDLRQLKGLSLRLAPGGCSWYLQHL